MGNREARLGEWLIQCDVCASVIYASERKKTWDGLVTCSSCWDPKHPQLNIKKVRDDSSVPTARPRVYPHDTDFDPYTPSGNIGGQSGGGL